MVRFLLLVLLLCYPAWAADKYVRAGAAGTGTGADWTNAYTAVPTTPTRGDTYFIADGNYNSATYEFAVVESGTSVVTFKKAIDDTRCAAIGLTTAQCRGDAAGWDDAYGDGVAKFSNIQINRGYFVMDGQITCSDMTNCTRGFNVGDGAGGLYIFGVSGSNAASNLTFKSITIDGVVENLMRGFRFCCNGGSNVLVENVEIKNVGNDPINLTGYNGWTGDRLYLHDRISGPDGTTTHGDAMEILRSPNGAAAAKNTLKNSIINWAGQHMWFTGALDHPINGEWDIHSNVYTSPTCGTGTASIVAIKFRDDDAYYSSAQPMNVYNNTFVCLYGVLGLSAATTGDFKNNIIYGITTNTVGWQNFTHDYNYFDTAIGSTYSEAHGVAGGDPFIGLATRNLHLTAATTAGATLAAPTLDPDGLTRGSDGTWDRGAFEFEAPDQPPDPPPATPRQAAKGKVKSSGVVRLK